MRKLIIVIFLIINICEIYSQELDVGACYGRFWSPYRYEDYGTGYRNQASSNYNFFPEIVLSKYISRNVSVEAGIFFTLYEQYYSTRKYILAFESTYGAGHITLRGGYSFVKKENIECRVKVGLSLGIAPDMYEADYVEMLVYSIVDSITRGVIKRNFTPVFPMVSTGLDVSYKIAKRLKICLDANYQRGFLKISQYDIYYNDGNGQNDQRAKQWGTGDFYAIQLGLRYVLKDGQGLKLGSKKNR